MHPSAARVQAALAARGVTGVVREFAEPTRTSAEAAAALGCQLGAIAMCLVVVADGRPVVVIKSGSHRADLAHLAAQLGAAEVRQATAAEVRSTTGQPIGGVAPVNWPTSPDVLIDVALRDHDEVWSAAGTPNAVFPTTYDELCRLTDATPVTVTPPSGSPVQAR